MNWMGPEVATVVTEAMVPTTVGWEPGFMEPSRLKQGNPSMCISAAQDLCDMVVSVVEVAGARPS